MKAVRLLEYSGPLVFEEVSTPTIARDEILVRIKSTAVNHIDLVKASGTARQILPIDLPWTPGHEFSGVVEQIGSDVAAGAPGDAAFGATEMGGAHAEYLAVKPAAIARKPSNLSFEEAASTTRRREHVRAPGCGPGREGHRRETARGSWDVAQLEQQDASRTARSCFV
jgi:NADPH:quinone reductase-like Zn-dependent oxidoreductase